MLPKGIRPVLSLSPICYGKPKSTHSHSLNVERETITQNGGRVNEQLKGADGHSTFSGRPMEVKYATKGRWRVGKVDHEEMLAKNGLYILVNEARQQLRLSAREIDRYIKYKWLNDVRNSGLNYQHAFIYTKDIHFR